MSLRISSGLIAFIVLAGCKPAQTDQTMLANVEAGSRAAKDDSGEIVCAAAGSNDFSRSCTVDREESADGLILTIRHPDGAFHKFLVTKDGRGVIAADGAEAAKVSVLGTDQIEVALGGARYRLPATVKLKKP